MTYYKMATLIMDQDEKKLAKDFKGILFEGDLGWKLKNIEKISL